MAFKGGEIDGNTQEFEMKRFHKKLKYLIKMSFKQILPVIQNFIELKPANLQTVREFAVANTWAKDSLALAERNAVDLHLLYKPSFEFILILKILLPTFDPLLVLERYMCVLFIPKLQHSENFETIENIQSMIKDIFKNDSHDYKTHVMSLMLGFCRQSNDCWEKIMSSNAPMHKINLGTEINSIENIIYEYGMSNPAEFYELLNELAVCAATRLNAFILLKKYLVLEV